MGNYNPHEPVILGQEWPGIRDENTQFSPAVDVVEYGHTFRTTSAYTLQDGRFYVHEMPINTADEAYVFAIYARGDEAETGPVRRIVIPAESVWVSGATVNGTAESALFTPELDYYILLDTDQLQSQVTTGFNTAPYTVLNGKRIVAVNVLYGAHRYFFTEDRDNGPYIYFGDSADPFSGNNIAYDSGNSIPEGGDIIGGETLKVKLGDVNRLWQTPITAEIMPWNFGDLQRFDGGAASRLFITFVTGQNFSAPANGHVFLWYAALEILFCEETRSIVGGLRTAVDGVAYGANVVRLRTLTTRALNPSLAVGNWSATLAAADQGGVETSLSGYPDLNALRELYALPTHEGIKINVTATEGETFTRESTNILTQLSVHASGGPLTEVHAYGRIAPAQVYGSLTATQEIYDDVIGTATQFPQVRYYARRFGNTTAPLKLDSTNVTGSGMYVQITPGEFDELPEIVDGWKEITLRFPTVPSMGATSPDPLWRWSATGETAGNRWEVLGVSAPAVSGIPGNLLNNVAAPHRLGTATYQPPSGSTVELSWQTPAVSGIATADSDTDAFLIFSQDPPTLTGLTLEALTQSVTGIGEDCGSTPCCIPTEIDYNLLTWSLPASGAYSLDTFSRVVTGFGTNDTGDTYTDSGGTVPDNYIINGSAGTHVLDGATNVNRSSTISAAVTDSHARVKIATNNAPSAGASVRGGIIGHFVDTSNYDFVDLRFATSGQAEIVITTRIAGTNTGNTNVAAGAYGANQFWYLDVDFNGSMVRAKAWPVDGVEPLEYQAEFAAAFTVGGYGLRSIRSPGNTNSDAVISYDDYEVTPSTWTFGTYELQRWDAITDWQTIMSATSPAITSFNDFEARVGQSSIYRIRATNLYNFAGAWSDAVTGTVPSPGVTVQCDTDNEAHGTLIFTSNAVQSGARNLAYVMQFDRSVEEAFSFPESGTSRLRRRYGRDFFTAFRPTERGGEQFSRVLLVQGAAGALPDMANVRSLRDLAWDDLPYVCVRDERGNRWFANVIVPDVNISQRSAYFAKIDITEVTDTSCEVDP